MGRLPKLMKIRAGLMYWSMGTIPRRPAQVEDRGGRRGVVTLPSPRFVPRMAAKWIGARRSAASAASRAGRRASFAQVVHEHADDDEETRSHEQDDDLVVEKKLRRNAAIFMGTCCIV